VGKDAIDLLGHVKVVKDLILDADVQRRHSLLVEHEHSVGLTVQVSLMETHLVIGGLQVKQRVAHHVYFFRLWVHEIGPYGHHSLFIYFGLLLETCIALGSQGYCLPMLYILFY
jgi:hypothetical protein